MRIGELNWMRVEAGLKRDDRAVLPVGSTEQHAYLSKALADLERLRLMGPAEVRVALGDGNYGGLYQRPDADLEVLWREAVAETRAAIEGPWGSAST